MKTWTGHQLSASWVCQLALGDPGEPSDLPLWGFVREMGLLWARGFKLGRS